jgi:hypothetical protein
VAVFVVFDLLLQLLDGRLHIVALVVLQRACQLCSLHMVRGLSSWQRQHHLEDYTGFIGLAQAPGP